MASEREENHSEPKEIIEHFFSPVVEGITLLSSLVEPKQHEFAKTDQERLLTELSDESMDFLKVWRSNTDWDFLEHLSLLIPCPYFYDIELFLDKLATISDVDYLYNLFGEEISVLQIEELTRNPSVLEAFKDNILWDTSQKRTFIMDLISNIAGYRKSISKLLFEVINSQVLLQRIRESNEVIDKSLTELRSMKMEPLALAQYVMGKTFQRTSLYKMYYFIPSYYLTPHRMRIFNSEICMVFYGCASPLSDARETSTTLEAQLKALSDRNRLLMLRMLSGKKEYGAKLAEYLGITTATVSHHLEILKKAGFVKEEKVGNIKYFSCEQEFTKGVFKEIENFVLSEKV